MRLPATTPNPPVGDAAIAAPIAAPLSVAQRAASVAAASAPAAATAASASATDVHALHELVDKLSQTIGTTGQQVQFSIDHDTHQTVLKVTDAESGALLRQIPGDEALSMARILDRMQGILIRQKA